jgi:hypothetical protein
MSEIALPTTVTSEMPRAISSLFRIGVVLLLQRCHSDDTRVLQVKRGAL